MVLKVGLTGGMASGKSTVAARLRERGIPVLDADQVVRDLYRPGGAGARAVAEEFGREVLDESGAVDRPRLAARVFGSLEAVARLNARVHPLVIAEQALWYQGLEATGDPVGVVEATLLVESGGRARYDLVVVVSASEETRLARALARSPGASAEELRRRMSAQLPDAERERSADVVLTNDGDVAVLRARADELAARLTAEAAARRGASGPG